ATLRAPFDGVVANIEAKKYNRADQSKPFCRVLGADMDVEFNMLESEIGLINIGDKVEILPYSTGDMFSGHITEINPTVNSDGMVRATASVGYGNALCDGQNVKVRVKKDVGNQLTVPKSAVVLRSGKPVVFTLNETGDKAIWNYVTIGLENMTEYTITDGLTEGMTVITDGNVNLAHQSPVKIVKQ
ncbi:MAG: HlyD family efflux transporter periplasmic adaptor subunit, partial [Muribaculum sp.]|nr:HlyD family efflux transporter periplasmic adaptor subunit [Muribaculum sp.]